MLIVLYQGEGDGSEVLEEMVSADQLSGLRAVQEGRVLLLDEPTNHLDIGAQHQVLRIVREQRLATIVVLHDLNLAARCCDRVMVLREGVVAADGPPAEALGAGLVEDLYDVSAEPVRAADGTAQLLFRGDGAHRA